MDTIILACAITGIVCGGLGILLGMSLQWRRSEAYIKRLEAKVVDLRAKAAKGKPMITFDIDDYCGSSDDSEDDDWDVDGVDVDEGISRPIAQVEN